MRGRLLRNAVEHGSHEQNKATMLDTAERLFKVTRELKYISITLDDDKVGEIGVIRFIEKESAFYSR